MNRNRFSTEDEKIPKGTKWAKWFILSAGILLFITGIAKIVSALGRVAVLGKPDPVLGIPFNYLLLSVGLIEVVIAVLCVLQENQSLALGLVAAISVNFLSYRAGLWLIQWPGYCPCLGSVTQAIGLSVHHANLLTMLILIYLLLGSFSFLALAWLAPKGMLAATPRGSSFNRVFWLCWLPWLGKPEVRQK